SGVGAGIQSGNDRRYAAAGCTAGQRAALVRGDAAAGLAGCARAGRRRAQVAAGGEAMSAQRAMRLDDLLRGIAEVPRGGEIVISGLTQDSRAVRAGDAFVALRGARAHGIAFAETAVAQGAVAVLAEKPTPESRVPSPVIQIEHLRTHLGEIAARFFDHPSETMTLIGVTG